jgi:hypothetical protein
VNGFNLVTPPEVTDPEAEMEGEDLSSIGNVIKAAHWGVHLFAYLTRRWLRLTQPNGDRNRARWGIHPTWLALQEGFAQVYEQRPLSDAHARLVRLHRHSGYGRGLERMAVGIMTTAEALLDADPATVLPGFLEQVKRQTVAARAAQQAKRAKKALGVAEGRRLKYLEQV